MTLDDANTLLEWMRRNGVRSARVGDVSLDLAAGAEPDAPPSLEKPRFTEPKRYDDPLDDPDLYDGETVPGIMPDDTKSILVLT